MGDFFARRRELREGPARLPTCGTEFKQKYKSLGALLSGTMDDKGKWEVPPFTLTLFAGDGAVKFCLAAKENDEAYFGVAPGVSDLMGEIESALNAGAVEQRQQKRTNGKPVF